jgi:hypothetical protein
MFLVVKIVMPALSRIARPDLFREGHAIILMCNFLMCNVQFELGIGVLLFYLKPMLSTRIRCVEGSLILEQSTSER